MFPAVSVARSSKVWGPVLTRYFWGDSQDVKAGLETLGLFRRHSKVLGSLAENLKVTLWAWTVAPSLGPSVIVATGGVVSGGGGAGAIGAAPGKSCAGFWGFGFFGL